MSNSVLLEAFMQSRDALLRYLVVRGAATDEAEDILQDLFVRLSSAHTGPVEQPRAYLYRMVTNHFLLQRRTMGRRERREASWVQIHAGEPPEVDETPSAHRQMVDRQKLAILQRAVDGLPERTRHIFRRFRIEGEPQRQIASEIDISVSAVEKHLARAYEAIAKVKRQFDEDSGTSRSLKGARGRHDD